MHYYSSKTNNTASLFLVNHYAYQRPKENLILRATIAGIILPFNVFLRGSFLAVCVRIWLLCLSCISFWYQFMPSSFFLLYHLCTVVILIKNTPSLFGISLDDLNKWPPGRKNNFPLGIYCNKLNTQNTI